MAHTCTFIKKINNNLSISVHMICQDQSKIKYIKSYLPSVDVCHNSPSSWMIKIIQYQKTQKKNEYDQVACRLLSYSENVHISLSYIQWNRMFPVKVNSCVRRSPEKSTNTSTAISDLIYLLWLFSKKEITVVLLF